MKQGKAVTVNTRNLSEIHRDYGLPVPAHPLISLIEWPKHQIPKNNFSGAIVSGFYRITFNTGLSGKSKYGQGYYDYSEGGMTFVAPTQVISPCVYDVADDWSMYTLLIHPDFLWNYPIAKTIKQYGFFSYNTNEALHLSDKEKSTIIAIFENIQDELNSRIDDVTQNVIIAQIELLLSYADRFYKRQFITRKVVNNDLLQKMDDMLDDYLNSDKTLSEGIPTVHFLAEKLNVSPSYLSDMVRSVNGQSALGIIHQKIIEKAKEKLSGTNMSVSEVAYELGFGHPSSFTKLFKTKTNLSPLEFRKSFN
ncbi:helix-turn-helix domain-containing protein [Chitinophaga pinensis]|uniref:Transcriptional regulator, AraC family n=1 Tax=Chitinophaga pinensis (strain ATCC 43595 / DSM 2588 / LMG 13176 / NBRC 15968 / NCIMB 11800 / UQM 2034) TaxID=485918 RepID=A0A979G856_CHIPD|nr:helix-turn-helix transcriptional regulator [Chitinophaga pinensis]ACU62565.1 transcriptional regulator, AraC family [Chitinophaga pinensis DSM 2588]